MAVLFKVGGKVDHWKGLGESTFNMTHLKSLQKYGEIELIQKKQKTHLPK
jgi:hypothetical protein